MARARVKPTDDHFFESLNSQNDLVAIIYGLATLEANLDEALDLLLTDRDIKAGSMVNLRFMEKVEALVVADRLDADMHALFAHVARIRNRFAHRHQTTFTKAEGHEAYDLLPDRAKARTPPRLLRDSKPGRVVRWCIVVLWARIRNRAIHGHEPSLPF